mmetsp:Transcript_57915/g.176437  ORF Transcript_57915/g.176437 Transcript_57915/m.176437 type:complete len:214 (+) Transcript_57915:168-809(+)
MGPMAHTCRNTWCGLRRACTAPLGVRSSTTRGVRSRTPGRGPARCRPPTRPPRRTAPCTAGNNRPTQTARRSCRGTPGDHRRACRKSGRLAPSSTSRARGQRSPARRRRPARCRRRAWRPTAPPRPSRTTDNIRPARWVGPRRGGSSRAFDTLRRRRSASRARPSPRLVFRPNSGSYTPRARPRTRPRSRAPSSSGPYGAGRRSGGESGRAAG